VIYSRIRELIPGTYHEFPVPMGGGKVLIGTGVLTPESAEVIRRNHQPENESGGKFNRPTSANNKAFILRQIQAKSFKVTGETQVFDSEEFLLDGQHRVEACSEGSEPIPVVVVVGVPRENFSYMGQGRVRTASDVLSILGYTNTAKLAGAVKALNFFEMTGRFGRGGNYYKLSNSEVVSALESKYPALLSRYMDVTNINDLRAMYEGTAIFAAMYYTFSTVDAAVASEMIRVLSEPMLTVTDTECRAFLLLREHLQLRLSSVRRSPKDHLPIITIKAWNSVMTRKPLKQLKYDERESYPTIHGIQYKDGIPAINHPEE
jgi:hypothetical protein